MYSISLLFMKFILISIFGYIAEMTMCWIVEKKLANRGFFCGPIIPIYGIGSLSLIFLLDQYKSDPLVVFVFGIIITTTLEYITGYLLEKIFHNKWWDYSKNKFNLNGRICLLNSFLFGIGTLVVIYIANPIFNQFLGQINHTALMIVALSCFLIFLMDLIYSATVAYDLRHRIIVIGELKNQKLAKIPGMLERMMKRQIDQFKRYPSRLLKAFPTIKKTNEKEFEIMKKLHELNKPNKKKKANSKKVVKKKNK